MITTAHQLKEEIMRLEVIRHEQERLLRLQFTDAYESIKPINLIKGVFRDAVSVPGLPGQMVSSVLGLGAGFVGRKILFGKSRNPIKNLIGSLLQFGIARMVTKHPDALKASASKVYHKVFSKNKTI